MSFSKYWPNLPEKINTILNKNSQSFIFKRGETIYLANEKPKGIYLIESGLVGFLIIGQNSGKEHLLRFFQTGEVFGHRSILSNELYHGNTIAIETTKLNFLPKKILLELLSEWPILYKDILQILAKELRQSETQHVLILEKQILARTALSLVYLKEFYPTHNWTRQEIANFCGSTTSTIIKTMATLEELGYLKQNGRKFEILNRKALLDFENK